MTRQHPFAYAEKAGAEEKESVEAERMLDSMLSRIKGDKESA